jgi:hypothetical protein
VHDRVQRAFGATRAGRAATMKIGPIHISIAALLIIVILVILLA